MGAIVWLASYPKSGSTWLRAFLHNYLRDPAEPWNINRLLELSTNENDAGFYQRYDPRPAARYRPADVRRMRPLVHHDLTRLLPGPVLVKTHNAALADGGVPLQTPEVTAGSIYVVRDPRDVAVSYAHHLGQTIDQTIALMGEERAAAGGTDEHVYERLASWSTHVASWTGRRDPRLLVLRYEDMESRPGEAFGTVVRFLGLDIQPARLDKAIEFSRFDRLRDQELRHGFVEKPAVSSAFFRSGRSGGWREALSPAQAARLTADHRLQMKRFSYA